MEARVYQRLQLGRHLGKATAGGVERDPWGSLRGGQGVLKQWLAAIISEQFSRSKALGPAGCEHDNAYLSPGHCRSATAASAAVSLAHFTGVAHDDHGAPVLDEVVRIGLA